MGTSSFRRSFRPGVESRCSVSVNMRRQGGSSTRSDTEGGSVLPCPVLNRCLELPRCRGPDARQWARVRRRRVREGAGSCCSSLELPLPSLSLPLQPVILSLHLQLLRPLGSGSLLPSPSQQHSSPKQALGFQFILTERSLSNRDPA